MSKWHFVSETGEKLPCAYIDGYWFGDRLLEGVMFKITITPKRKFMAEVAPQSKAYMESLNERKWVKEAERCAEDNDIFYASESGDMEAWIEDEQGNKDPHLASKPKPIAIQATCKSIFDIVEEVKSKIKGGGSE